jgi:hypothetical protein
MEYTNEPLRNRIKARLMAGNKGGKPGQWSARKSQMLAIAYVKAGGRYRGNKGKTQKSMERWTEQEWQTKDGKKAIGRGKDGDQTARYLPKARWEKLTAGEAKATDQKKREASKSGTQFVANTKKAKSD